VGRKERKKERKGRRRLDEGSLLACRRQFISEEEGDEGGGSWLAIADTAGLAGLIDQSIAGCLGWAGARGEDEDRERNGREWHDGDNRGPVVTAPQERPLLTAVLHMSDSIVRFLCCGRLAPRASLLAVV